MLTYLEKYNTVMKIPCARLLPVFIAGFSFLEPALTNIQYQNLTLIATALVLGSKFKLTNKELMFCVAKT